MARALFAGGLCLLNFAARAHGNLAADILAYKYNFEANAQANRLAEVSSFLSAGGTSSSSLIAGASSSSSLSAAVSSGSPGFSSTSAGAQTATSAIALAPAATNVAAPSFTIYSDDTLPTSPAPSSSCATALTSTISCNYTIQFMGNIVFNASDLSFMCTETCSNSLVAYRNSVASACAGFSFSTTQNATYPATLGIDTLSEPYFSQCRVDATTGNFCQSVLSTYTPTDASQGILGYHQNELCTSCMLGLLNTTLSYAYSFTDSLYGTLQSALAECGPSWNSYNVSTPGAGSFGTTPPTQSGSNSTVDPICELTGHNVTTSAVTLCSDLAAQNSVTVRDILDSNPSISALACASGLASGTTACTLYTVKANQTCDDILADVNQNNLVGEAALINIQVSSFNPDLISNCANLPLFPTICISPHGGFTSLGNGGGSAVPTATPTATVPPPGQTPPGTTANCGAWYFVEPGNFCQQVALNNSITLDDFITLNPEINANCTNLWAEYFYCVAAFPPLSATSTIPMVTSNATAVGTLLVMSLTTATTPLTTQDLPSATGMPAPTNIAAGTVANGCAWYYTMDAGFNCTWIESYFNISEADFNLYNYNPDPPCPNLNVGSAYCVQVLNDTATIPPTPTNAAQGSAPSGCLEWYTVVSGDGCTSIQQKFGLSAAQFAALNPELTSTCTNLGLGEAYCVRAIGQISAAVPTNAVAGTDNEDCAKYDTVISGDSCSAIETRNGISDSLFRALNPEINAACTNIQLGSAYCVAAVPTFSFSTTSSSSTPTNVASGTDTKDCAKYDTVISGDTCPVIEARNGISDALFRALNPEINAACSNIILGEEYCVAAVPSFSLSSTSAAATPTNVATGTDTKINAACTNIILGEAYCVAALPGVSITSTSTTTAPTGAPTNVASGTWTNCTSYYTVVSGDNCNLIETRNSLSFTDFLKWNPEVNTACTNIGLGAAYCIAGTPKTCQKIYTVVSNDFCSEIESANGLTAAQFTALNPWLDANCDLQVGQVVCVG
ncbi:hypothetical protein MSAN_00276800 [Mycena sanguinolenta]|uniref:LysM domain-containing protein n=1 Tax=Mycena sanguinolenta TaxID=230812 RepID=A0A8H6ZJ63_9AGAR|nr:hypothetical protein MSAN_00276800 [Mycena sanguinolenta]